MNRLIHLILMLTAAVLFMVSMAILEPESKPAEMFAWAYISLFGAYGVIRAFASKVEGEE